MNKQFPIQLSHIKTHFHYNWYKYILVLIAAIGIPTLLLSVLCYSSPADNRIDFFVVDAGTKYDTVEAFLQEIAKDTKDAEFETITAECQVSDTSGEIEQVILLRLALNQEVDIAILPYTYFSQYAQQGIFLPLEVNAPQLMNVLPADAKEKGKITFSDDTHNETHVYGFPLSCLPALYDSNIFTNRDLYISVFYKTGNDTNVLRVLNRLVRFGLDMDQITWDALTNVTETTKND